MIRTQVQFPDLLYERLKAIAAQHGWSLADVLRKAAEHFASRFPVEPATRGAWHFPTFDCGGDFLVDPAELHVESDAILQRSGREKGPGLIGKGKGVH